MDGNYFDITHSFQIDSSTYHVLGLRKDRPTYGNTYYIFNCSEDQSRSILPRISVNRTSNRDNSNCCLEHEKNFRGNRSRSQKNNNNNNNNLTEIKETLTELMKQEHEQLINSLRKDIQSERTTLMKSFEKENEVLHETTTLVKNDKQDLTRFIEKQKISLENTFERHMNNLNSSIELLKKTLTQTLRTQQEQLQSIQQFYTNFNQNIERQIEQIFNKQYEQQRTTTTTSNDSNLMKQIQTTIIETIEKHSSTRNNDDNLLKDLLNEQKQYFTDLIMKQQRTYINSLNEIKELHKNLLEILKETSTTTNNEKDKTSMKTLFNEQTKELSELIQKQQNSFSFDRFQETISKTFQEEFSRNNSFGSIRPFKLSIKSGEFVHVFARLYIDGNEYPKDLHTLCQKDPIEENVIDCFISPPILHGPCEVIIYAKTSYETEYQATLCVQISDLKLSPFSTFPKLHQSFQDYQCILIEPLRRTLKIHEEILLQMIIPNAERIQIQNGDQFIDIEENEYENNFIKKFIKIQGNLIIFGQWNKNQNLPICTFKIE